MKNAFVILSFLFLLYSCDSLETQDDNNSKLKWLWVMEDTRENANKRIVHQETFGENNQIRLLQSMSLFDNKVFCFNDGTECYIFNIDSKKVFNSGALPEKSHHNNAQFLDVYFDKGDKYPLLLLSRGDYPPNQNEFYIVRVIEKNDSITFHRVKTIKNTIAEAKNGGSWVADEDHNKLFLYCMTTGDYRKKEDNVFCVFSFDLPNIMDSRDCTLTYDDVTNYWEYQYLIHQGGTYYNGYLFFNVQNLTSIYGVPLESSFNVIAINVKNGKVEIALPIDNSIETEGIGILNDKLYVCHKNGNSKQDKNSVVFRLYEYSLPASIETKSN